MVGRIRTVWFFSSQGEAQERVSVGIVPFRQCDLGAALRLARNKARPSPGEYCFVVHNQQYQIVLTLG